jgi:hypothetical protein
MLMLIALVLSFGLVSCEQIATQGGVGKVAEAKDVALVGHNDLQARSAYQPIIHRQANRFIAYIGHHGGSALNSLTGKVEANGTPGRSPIFPRHEDE